MSCLKTTRLGIIGCGIIAGQHLQAYEKMEDVEVVAICDIDAGALNAAGERFSIGTRYASFREMLKRDDIDAVDICLHNNLHAPVTIEVLRAGFHAYCEKPMAGSWADAKAMFDVAQKCGKLLNIQLGFIYSPETRAAKKLIDAGRLGDIYHVRSKGFRRRGRPFVDGYATKEFNSRYIASGGALFDMGVYHISQLLYLLGSPKLKTVSGSVYQKLSMDDERQAASGFDVEELGVGFARYENGLTLDLIESWAIHMKDFGGSWIAGSLGGVCLDPFSFHTFENDVIMDISSPLSTDEYRNHQLQPTLSAYDSAHRHWVSALNGVVPLLPTAQIALDTMLLSEGIYLSNERGGEVTVEEIMAASKSKALPYQDADFGRLEYAAYPF